MTKDWAAINPAQDHKWPIPMAIVLAGASNYCFSYQHRLDNRQPLLPEQVHGLVLVEGGPGLLDPGECEGDPHLV